MKVSSSISAILGFPGELWLAFITYLPGQVGFKLRSLYWGRKLGALGDKAMIDVGVHFSNPAHIFIGRRTWIDRGVILLAGPDRGERPKRVLRNPRFKGHPGEIHIGACVHIAPYCLVSGIGGVSIGDNCGLASGCKVFSFSHHFRSQENPDSHEVFFTMFAPPEHQFLLEGPVTLEDNVGLASNVIVLPGAAIGKESFITVGSVVMSTIPGNSIAGGNPAKRLQPRFPDGS
jgi:acetyltransferase-like isoleucine patch superfamily enzyme